MKTKHLLGGVAVIAALAFSAPVGAQVINPGNANTGGNAMGMPGPNPGGPALTPYSTGAAPPAPAPSASGVHGRMPAGGKKTSTRGGHIPPPSASDTTSATPPTHRHARAHHATHGTAHGTMAHGPRSVTDTAAQLNQAELARLQQGAPPMAPQMAPPPPQMQGGNSMGMPGPSMGGRGLTPYSSGTPMGTTGGGAPYRP